MFLNIDKKEKEHVALEDDFHNVLTYGDLVEFVHSFKNVIQSRNLVFLLCSNTTEMIATFISCIENKIVPLLLNKNLDNALLNVLIKTYEPQYIITDINNNISNLEMEVKETFRGIQIYKTNYNQYNIYNDLAFLLPTSGTTGSPKLVRHSYGNINYSYKTVADFFGYTHHDIGLADLPMHYTMGLSVICSHLYAGAKVVLTNYNLMSKEFWNKFFNEDITDFTGVPFSYEIFERLRFFQKKHPTLRILAEGGGRLNDRLYKTLSQYCLENGIKFFPTFGTTETTARMAYLQPELTITKIGSIGNAIQGSELILLDNDENIISELESEGILAYRGPNVTLGYAFNKEDLLKEDERKGYYITGDIAKRDSDGCFYILGRTTRFVKLYGLRISLDQCENIIRNKFKIDCACIGNDKVIFIYIEDKELSNSIYNYIITTTGLYRHNFKMKYVTKIPRNASGKILYKELELGEGLV